MINKNETNATTWNLFNVRKISPTFTLNRTVPTLNNLKNDDYLWKHLNVDRMRYHFMKWDWGHVSFDQIIASQRIAGKPLSKPVSNKFCEDGDQIIWRKGSQVTDPCGPFY